MIKLFSLIAKRPDLTDEQFHEHWRTVHARLALRITALRRYVQSHRLIDEPTTFPSPPFGSPPYLGVAEAWFDDYVTAAAMQGNPAYAEGAKPDEANFMDLDCHDYLLTEETVVVRGPPMTKDTSAVKGLFLLARRPGSSVDDFLGWWGGRQAALVAKTPNLLRYVQSRSVHGSDESQSPPRYDGVAELWWPERSSFEEAWESAAMKRALDDAAGFVGSRSAALIAEEIRVLWP